MNNENENLGEKISKDKSQFRKLKFFQFQKIDFHLLPNLYPATKFIFLTVIKNTIWP